MLFLFFLAIALLFFAVYYWNRLQNKRVYRVASEIVEQAETKALMLLDQAKIEINERQIAAQQQIYAQHKQLEKEQLSISGKLEQFLRDKQKLQAKVQELEKKEKALVAWEKELKDADTLHRSRLNLSEDQARSAILTQVAKEIEKDCHELHLHKYQEAKFRLDADVQKLIITALGRLPHKALQDASTSYVAIPNEEMKAKIIGREGKNIKAFQQLTGVQVVIDDQPNQLTISCFDPERRELAKLALHELVQDGRISVGRIEEAVSTAYARLNDLLVQFGQEAVSSLHLHGLHPELCRYLGCLKLRTSLGQNLLEHSLEVAHIMGLLCTELKLNVSQGMRMGLLHDIGKAVTSTNTTSHAIAGYRLCLEWGEAELIANAVGCHHDEMKALTQEAMLVKCADYLSGARLGARAESSETFFKRLSDFEAMALECPGVKTAFAVSAGRELQVFVKPEVVDDAAALALAKAISQKIQLLSGPSKVQVTVIRETRAVEYTQ